MSELREYFEERMQADEDAHAREIKRLEARISELEMQLYQAECDLRATKALLAQRTEQRDYYRDLRV